jgi:pimeloyl-ACP methyl ester carboxylesterase
MPSCIDLFEAHVGAVDGPVVERNDQLAAGPDQAFGECPRIPISPALRQGNQRFAAEKAMADNGTDAVRDPVTLGADEWLARLAELPLAFQPGRAGATTSRSPRRSAKTSHSTVDWSPWSYEHRSHRVIAGPPATAGPGSKSEETTMTIAVATSTDVQSFRIEIPQERFDDLRRRIAATRLPSKELVEDRSQGVQLATIQELARYWTTDYDFGRIAMRLNALPQFTTEIDGVEIHFIHVRSRHEDALPLIMTHGWPGSVIELLETVGPLTDPTAHGGRAEDAFHLVLPSLPGYGFSSEPTELGWDAARTGRAWAELMHRLGYTRYVAQGGDVGALVTDLMGRQAVEGLAGYHLNLLTAVLAIGDHLPRESEQERAAAAAVATFRQDGFGYFLEMATRPQTIGYALLDSPVALAAWLLDHDTDSYYKISRAFVAGEPVGNLTRDNVLDNITLYWLTGTAASAARSYWEDARALAAAIASGQPPPPVTVPVGFTTFPGEIWASPRSWVEAVYPDLAYFNEADKGGHFAAWEEPQVFAAELRAAFRSLRD